MPQQVGSLMPQVAAPAWPQGVHINHMSLSGLPVMQCMNASRDVFRIVRLVGPPEPSALPVVAGGFRWMLRRGLMRASPDSHFASPWCGRWLPKPAVVSFCLEVDLPIVP